MEQIRATAYAGLQQLSRGGLEVGGILLGEHSVHSTRILSWRPMLCEHARGPAFLLTDKELAELANLLLSLSQESSNTNLHPLGWFVSHTRSAAAITGPDLEIYRQFFPELWQTTLVLNPARDGNAQANFYVRDPNGQVGPASPHAFSISPEPDLNPKTAGPGPAAPDSPRLPMRLPKPAIKLPMDSRRAARKALSDRRIWIWLGPALLALVVLGTLVDRDASSHTGASKPTSFGFRATDTGGVLRLEWDRNSETIRNAARATLDIQDGKISVPMVLDSDRMRAGFFNYSRKSNDLELRMTVFPFSGAPVQEFTKFAGAPLQPRLSADEAAALRQDRDSLKAQVRQLRESLRQESTRNRQLQDTVRILKQRVQVEKFRSPSQR